MTANLKPYPNMKDSGLESLGTVPAHWEVLRLRNVTEMRVSNVDKHSRQNETPVRLCNYVDVYKNDLIRPGLPFMRATATAGEIERFGLRSGDVLITKDSEVWNDIGVPALVEETEKSNPRVVSGYHLALLRPYPERINSGYLFRSLQSRAIANQLHVQANGVTRFGLTRRAIKAVRMPLPPLREQVAIVRFLDHADRRIQRYIRAKQELIILLYKQKQTVTDQAIMGQINVQTGRPYPAYKTSGMRSSKTVPEHWTVPRLGSVVDIRASNVDKHSKPYESRARLCNYLDVYRHDYIDERMNFMQATATDSEISRFILKRGDVLITKDSESWNDIGVPALVTEPAPDLISGYHLALLRPRSDVLSGSYLLRALQSSDVSYQFHIEAKGVIRYGLSYAAIKSARIPLPPVGEQAAVAGFLDDLHRRTGEYINAARKSIELLKEFRTRLIADVIVGRIDVRKVSAI